MSPSRRVVSFVAAGAILGSATTGIALENGARQPVKSDAINAAPYAVLTPTEVRLGNGLVERRWRREGFSTTLFLDKRSKQSWARQGPDFQISVAGATLTSADFYVVTASTLRLANGGQQVTLELSNSASSGQFDHLVGLTRTMESYPGVAGIRSQTILHLAAPTALTSYTLDEVGVGPVTSTVHAFRAGSDWSSPRSAGPQAATGDPRSGDYRHSTTGGVGRPVSAPGEWLSLARGEPSLFMVMERNDQPSSQVSYDGATASLVVKPGADIAITGPLESDLHAENPVGTGRSRVVGPGDVALEPAFVGLSDHAGDEAWQFHRYLGRNGTQPAGHTVVYNTVGTDANLRSSGAKDDVDISVVEAVAPKLRALGVDTFVLGDGWQAASGDWCPDSPQCPEPRWDGSKTSKFRPRFPDADFVAVRQAIAPMRLGLWMSPTQFNPAAQRFKDHPEQACAPLGTGLAVANIPMDTGMYESGVGGWSPQAFPYVEDRIRYAIEHWGVTYFKFDFMVWLDCVGHGDLFEYRRSFLEMIDHLTLAHPEVQFQIDETSDYRLFPFESTSRGSAWLFNGKPPLPLLLHALWDLSPWVPAQALGGAMLAANPTVQPIATQMAASLLSVPTYVSDPRTLPAGVTTQARPWVDLFHKDAAAFSGVVYPLLADPINNRWTGLQSWNPETRSGAVLAFRQQSSLHRLTLPLSNIGDGTYEVRDALSGRLVGVRSAAQLRTGLDVTIPDRNGSLVLLVTAVTT